MNATSALTELLRKEMGKLAHDTGRVTHVEAYDHAKGGGWIVVFDTEYAALKVHYKFLGSPGLKFGKSPSCGGWFVSVR